MGTALVSEKKTLPAPIHHLVVSVVSVWNDPLGEYRLRIQQTWLSQSGLVWSWRACPEMRYATYRQLSAVVMRFERLSREPWESTLCERTAARARNRALLSFNSRSAFEFEIHFSVRDPLFSSRSAFQFEIRFSVRDPLFSSRSAVYFEMRSSLPNTTGEETRTRHRTVARVGKYMDKR
jgi:hypothetical protein